MTTQHSKIVEEIIKSEVTKYSKVYFLCNYRDSNIGDSSIAYATFCLLKKLEVRFNLLFPNSSNPRYGKKLVSIINNEKTLVLLPGGGNFGGLYPWNDDLRIWCLNNFPKARIVQLPQSIFFVSTEDEARLRLAFETHKNSRMLIRDSLSWSKIAGWTVQMDMCPDMVEILPVVGNNAEIPEGRLIRQDSESALSLNKPTFDVSFDWPVIAFFQRSKYWIFRRIIDFIPAKSLMIYPWNSRAFTRVENFHKLRFDLGLNLLRRFKILHTDRLHGLILGRKSSCDVRVYDNKNGKVMSYFTTWYGK